MHFGLIQVGEGQPAYLVGVVARTNSEDVRTRIAQTVAAVASTADLPLPVEVYFVGSGDPGLDRQVTALPGSS